MCLYYILKVINKSINNYSFSCEHFMNFYFGIFPMLP